MPEDIDVHLSDWNQALRAFQAARSPAERKTSLQTSFTSLENLELAFTEHCDSLPTSELEDVAKSLVRCRAQLEAALQAEA